MLLHHSHRAAQAAALREPRQRVRVEQHATALAPQRLAREAHGFPPGGAAFILRRNSCNVQPFFIFQKHPERFNFESLQEMTQASSQHQQQPQLPVYFSNVCLRFIPVRLSLYPTSNFVQMSRLNLCNFYRFSILSFTASWKTRVRTSRT